MVLHNLIGVRSFRLLAFLVFGITHMWVLLIYGGMDPFLKALVHKEVTGSPTISQQFGRRDEVRLGQELSEAEWM